MKRKALTFTAFAAALVLIAARAEAHCQIPCGIYDDELRVKLLEEHISTVEKSMKEIVRLSAQKQRDDNQIVRWVSNKESHADEIQQIVTAYFMTQRVKPDEPTTPAKLAALHKMLVSAMKAKQTTDLAHVKDLRAELAEFKKLYFGKP